MLTHSEDIGLIHTSIYRSGIQLKHILLGAQISWLNGQKIVFLNWAISIYRFSFHPVVNLEGFGQPVILVALEPISFAYWLEHKI